MKRCVFGFLILFFPLLYGTWGNQLSSPFAYLCAYNSNVSPWHFDISFHTTTHKPFVEQAPFDHSYKTLNAEQSGQSEPSFNSNTKAFLCTYDIPSFLIKGFNFLPEEVRVLRECIGTSQQQNLHNQCTAILHELYPYTKKTIKKPVQDIAHQTAHIVVVGCQANKLGDSDITRATITFGQKSAAICKAFVYGFKDGVKSGIHTMLHPIQTVKNFLYAAFALSDLLGGMLLDDYDCVTSTLSNQEIAEIKSIQNEKSQLLHAACKELFVKVATASAEDIVRELTTQAIETLLFSGVFKICKHTKNALSARLQYRQATPRAPPEKMFMQCSDGTLVHASPDVTSIMDSTAWWNKSRHCQGITDIRQLAWYSDTISLDAMEHIFCGQAIKGKSSGFHVLGMPHARGKIVVGTEQLINAEHRIWQANVAIDGILKGAKSTFYPIHMNPEQILKAIMEAYESRIQEFKNFYIGTTKKGMSIGMYLDKNKKIKTAFPMNS